MATIQREFGIKTDPTAGGSAYDVLTAGAVPDADTFFPTLPGATLNKGIVHINHDAWVFARRGRTKPVPLSSAPELTVDFPCTRAIVEKLFKKVRGGTDTVTGMASPYTHAIGQIGFGQTLPAVYAQLVRDDLNQKFSGAILERLELNFPLMEEGTCRANFWPLFYDQFVAAPPTAVYTGITEDVMMLRDAKIYIDGSASAIPDLVGFTFHHENTAERKWYSGRNTVARSIGSPAKTRKLWFPTENKIKADVDMGYGLTFGNVNTAQELAHDFAQIQKLVFEVTGAPITGGTELLRITIYGGVHSDATTDPMSKDGDLNTAVTGGAFYSDADAADVLIEVVGPNAAVIT